MNRRNFVLAWGRKLFFGISWPLTSLLGLVYLRSNILPQSTGEWFFFITNYIGHYGLMNALVYFLLYAPVVMISPKYYVSRFWSITLIVSMNFLVLADATFFATYGVHLYGLLMPLVQDMGLDFFFDASPKGLISIIGLFIISIIIWLRGEMIWRQMQGRFSNPIKNWYVVLIVLFFGLGQMTRFTNWGAGAGRLSQLFPLSHFLPKSPTDNLAQVEYQLPESSVACSGKANPNILLIVLREWNPSQLRPELMPFVSHLIKHGENFTNHYSGSDSYEGGLFSIQTSLSPFYAKISGQKEFSPIFLKALTDRSYNQLDLSNLSGDSPLAHDEKVQKEFKEWTGKQNADETNAPFFVFLDFQQHAFEADKILIEIIKNLSEKNLLKNTHVIITGAYGGNLSDNSEFNIEELKVPLVWISPERTSRELVHVTSHYDILPSMMEKSWGCKKIHRSMGLGKNISEKPKEDWLMVSTLNSVGIVDFKTGLVTTINSSKIQDKAFLEKTSKPRRKLVLDGLKDLIKFRHAR